jgi:hypothetical protein
MNMKSGESFSDTFKIRPTVLVLTQSLEELTDSWKTCQDMRASAGIRTGYYTSAIQSL